ncbi:hypothetical protein [Deinococcus pimensis]|uniref:hypothetical protein n=1 Tax=Deinococcus pimensis TaxID=309888 RepID=UPI000486A60A|nr:hypothetical protein [Deinococcus pimensis]
MNEDDLRRLNLLRQTLLGKDHDDKYAGMQPRAQMLQFVWDMYDVEPELPELRGALDQFVQMILVTYRETKPRNPDIASALAHSFMTDFPGTEGSRLLSRWSGLAEASYAVKAVAHSGNSNLIFTASKTAMQAMTEFLSGLLGFMVVCWQVNKGKFWSPTIFHKTLNEKLEVFEKLTGGNDGAFYLLFRLIDRRMRNAIAHGDIHLDRERGEVVFGEMIAKKSTRKEHRVPVVELMGRVMLASYLCQAYFVALCVIALYESGNSVERLQLPEHLLKVMASRALS